jgi:hypothetical protein
MCVNLCFGLWILQTKHTRDQVHKKEIWNFKLIYILLCNVGVVMFYSLNFVLLVLRVPAILEKAEINHLLIGTAVPV